MIDSLKIYLTNLNCFYPELLGLKFSRYKKNRIQENLNAFDATDELLDVVNHAIDSVPFYKKRYQEHLHSLDDFTHKMGFIDKDTVIQNFAEFLLPDVNNRKTTKGTTGGTSGKPLQLILPKDRYVFELATMYTMWSNIDWHGQTRAILRNHHLGKNQVFKVDPVKKEVIFDGFRTSDDYYFTIYKTLNKYKIRFIHAYPSSVYQLAKFIYRENLNIDFLKGVLCGSEMLLPEQKDLIQNRLGLKIYHWYGHSEKLVLGGYCRGSELIHVEPTYGYFELIDDKGKGITEVGKTGEIVGTTLHNHIMPLIRYRTGDFAEYAGDYCPYCKRYLPLIKNIEGRWDINRIYLSDMTYVSTTALNLHNDLYSFIDGMQYIQHEPGRLEIILIKGAGYNASIEMKLKEHFENAFKDKCEFSITYTNMLTKEANGKFLLLKQYSKELQQNITRLHD
ncbi:MAG TPA: phenylacetate--CoA ligase family protein [Spirochaetota bacterium]|nr:phenylacetate--CoA ligase family protein [Spirochaetota bacterium]